MASLNTSLTVKCPFCGIEEIKDGRKKRLKIKKIVYPPENVLEDMTGTQAILLMRMLNCPYCLGRESRSFWKEEEKAQCCFHCPVCNETEYLPLIDSETVNEAMIKI